MKKMLSTAVLALAFGSTAAFAHHPAEDIVDPDIYAMIDENVSDTPHADLTFDDMGSDTTSAMGGQDVASDAVAEVEEVQARGAMGSQR
jgi:hypothetical protein